MMREPGDMLPWWLDYHRRLGFSDFIILFDDPDDPSIGMVQGMQGVMAVPVDDRVRGRWRSLRHWPECGGHVDDTVGARQMLNIEHGFNLALEAGLDWLLHIDIDELFFPRSTDLSGHVSLLADTGKDAAAYYNYEAIPETFQVENCFREVTLFKKPAKMLQHQGIPRAGLWPRERRYFNFYNNGKSMVRVSAGAYPLGAHRWAHARRELNWVTFFNPAILHFSVCGFTAFEQKYRHRGNFGDMRMNKDLRRSGALLDLDARDAFARGDRDAAERIYRDRVMMEPATATRLLETGVLRRLSPARRVGW